MSRALWIGPRSYPLTPLSSLVPAIGDTVALVLYVALFVLAGIALLAPKPGWPIAAFWPSSPSSA
jgi:hypothetical protein